MLRRYGVQIFFYAHDHVFTDMVVDGIHYTLPGSAGAPWKFDTSETGYTSFWPDSGYGRVKVSRRSRHGRFRRDGRQRALQLLAALTRFVSRRSAPAASYVGTFSDPQAEENM